MDLDLIYDKFVERCYYVKVNSPNYFYKLKKEYNKILENFDDKTFEKLSIEKIKKSYYAFPEYFSSLIPSLDEKWIRLAVYPLVVRAYILGFDINKYIPTRYEVDEEFNKLLKIGVDEYCKQNKKYAYNLDETQEYEIMNPEDTICENPMDYNQFDRYDYLDKNKVYRFTRPEFKRILEDGLNFWNKCELPKNVLDTMKMRNIIATTLRLPPSDTKKNLIEKACEGRLYETLNEKENENEENVNILDNQNLVSLLTTRLLNTNSSYYDYY
jgi:hypothetical protein